MILLVDNYDSYTYNLAHLVAAVAGELPLVVPAGAVHRDRIPQRVRDGEFSHVLISPGPGSADNAADFSGSAAVIAAAGGIPLLGVCLGHQGLAWLAGSAISAAPAARHGFVSRVRHSGEGIFADLPQDFRVVRYHSLQVAEADLAAGVEVHARSEDGVVQGLRVSGQPHWGVQFHPESVLSEHGEALMRNFLALAPAGGAVPKVPAAHTSARPAGAPPHRLRLTHRVVVGELDCQRTFDALRASGRGADAFWLDSADARGSYSILGDTTGPLSDTIRYRLSDSPDVLSRLEQELAVELAAEPAAPSLPFTGGWVGYLGYECAQLTLPQARLGRHVSAYPDAYLVRPQSFIVYDHAAKVAHLCCLERDEPAARDGDSAALLDRLESLLAGPAPKVAAGGGKGASISEGSWRTPDYRDRIERALGELHAGESYEVCLTDTYEAAVRGDGDLYPQLRSHNPAPYAAHLAFAGLEVCSASPERFLTVRGGSVEAKPIKGTLARSEDPAKLAADPKTRAENLMIVDLLRNDLSRVCTPGTVRVPGLMEVETFATVHQLVSTVTGELAPGTSLVDLLRATFPPGSMTGSPKLRTCEIIDRLETGPRGVYSGALGYLGFDGQADLSVVIRTAVRSGERVTVGAGGAIVLDSDPAAEDAEKQLKADAVCGAWR